VDFFNLPNPLSRTTAMRSTQPLTEMSTRNLPGIKERLTRLTTLPPSVSRLSRENVGASTSHKPMSLHGLLHGQLHLFSSISNNGSSRSNNSDSSGSSKSSSSRSRSAIGIVLGSINIIASKIQYFLGGDTL
jgi:hypothetical protein